MNIDVTSGIDLNVKADLTKRKIQNNRVDGLVSHIIVNSRQTKREITKTDFKSQIIHFSYHFRCDGKMYQIYALISLILFER